jgi:hypothetical protein
MDGDSSDIGLPPDFAAVRERCAQALATAK